MEDIELGSLSFDTDFQLAFIGGLAFLFIYCYDSFNTPVKSSGSFVTTLAPRELASNQDYLKAFLVYLFLMTMIYALLSVFLPHILEAAKFAGLVDASVGYAAAPEGDDGGNSLEVAFGAPSPEPTYVPAWIPMAIAMILTGISTNYQWLNKIELSVRSATHRIIGIPDGIEKLARRIQHARFDLAALDTADIQFIHEKYKLITDKDLDDVTTYYDDVLTADPLRRWIRMQFLFDRIENKKHILSKAMNVYVFEHYDFVLNRIRLSIFGLSDLEKIKPILAAGNNGIDPSLATERNAAIKQIDSTLHDIHALLAASIFQRSNDPASVTRAFNAVSLSTTAINKDNIINGVIAAIFALFILVIVIVLLTPAIAALLQLATSDKFPQNAGDALIWATSAISLHGTAAIVAWQYQNKRIVARRWRPMNFGKFDVPALQYAVACFVSYLAGSLGLLVWWCAKQLLTDGSLVPTEAELWIPIFGTLGMVTGFWVSYTVDVTQRRDVTRRRLTLQPLNHAVSAGLVGYFLMTLLLIQDPDPAFSIYVGVVTALQGGLIGTIVTLFSHHQFSNRAAAVESLEAARVPAMA